MRKEGEQRPKRHQQHTESRQSLLGAPELPTDQGTQQPAASDADKRWSADWQEYDARQNERFERNVNIGFVQEEIRQRGLCPSYRKLTEQGKTVFRVHQEQNDQLEQRMQQALSEGENAFDEFFKPDEAEEHLGDYIRHLYPGWSVEDVKNESEFIRIIDGVTDREYILGLLIKLDDADAEIRKTNPDWKPWYQRD
jgi:hypothetical protein